MIRTAEISRPRIVSDFSQLDVWKKAFDVSLLVHKASLTFPKIEQFAMADQIRRASKSICANIAEGFSKQGASSAEFKRFLQMAMASGNEMIVWVKYCKALEYIDDNTAQYWESEYVSICKMLNALHAKS